VVSATYTIQYTKKEVESLNSTLVNLSH